jgi:hypothetical protein
VSCRCGRDNDARRCYCGACGRRIGKACARCQFLNSTDDAFCGGCGDGIEAAAVVSTKHSDVETAPMRTPAPPPTPAAAPASSAARAAKNADGLSADELAALIGKSAVRAPAQLPAIVSQDDLDRLFGSVS